VLLPNLLSKASNPERDSPFRERERERERKKVGKQTAEWQQASSAAIAQTISVRGTQDPSERLPQKVCEKRVQGLGFRVRWVQNCWVGANKRERHTDRQTKEMSKLSRSLTS
jgi:hypothetical protein